jgi:hypothetical protein
VQAAYLAEANPSAISHAVRDVLERHGALVTEHVSSRVRFHALADGSKWSWDRAGYVGIYQRFGEKEVEVRLDLKARWPHRILWTVASVNVLVWLVTAIWNPPGTTWFVFAFLTGLALIVSGLVYLNTWRGVNALERQLMVEFEAEFQKDHVAAAMIDLEQRELEDAEAALAGEIERIRLAKARKDAPKPAKPAKEKAPLMARAGKMKLAFGKKKDADEEAAPLPTPPVDEEAQKQARLAALREEIERRKREGGV